jgi:uncharacterized protein YjbI with pentapeptide repeats
LKGAVLDYADLTDANLTEADLSYDNLGGPTSLLGTCRRGAILTQAKFDGASYNDETVFPEGFDPQSAGMVREESAETRS